VTRVHTAANSRARLAAAHARPVLPLAQVLPPGYLHEALGRSDRTFVRRLREAYHRVPHPSESPRERDGSTRVLRAPVQRATPPRADPGQSFYMPYPPAGQEVVRKRCTSCKLLRPLLTSHCRLCNNCVLEFDQ
jgi:hypothetical protein